MVSPLVLTIPCPSFLLHLLANLLLRLYAVFNKDKRLLVSVLAIGVVLLCVDGVSSSLRYSAHFISVELNAWCFYVSGHIASLAEEPTSLWLVDVRVHSVALCESLCSFRAPI